VHFEAPAGAEVELTRGAGTTFLVAVLTFDGHTCIGKRLTPRMADEPLGHAAVERERQLLTMVDHPALPRLLHHGTDDFGPFLIETRAPGRSLAELVAQGPLPSSMLTELTRAAFGALADIHRHPRGVALGDLTPEDLFVGHRRGEVCFVDFGQSSWRERPPEGAERGTLPYTPPEVARGEARWTQASDVYALAATLLHAAVGREPCDAMGPARLIQIADHGLDASLIATVPDPLGIALGQALTFAPTDRRSTAVDVLMALAD
jgi:serine/threonine-protein kinase